MGDEKDDDCTMGGDVLSIGPDIGLGDARPFVRHKADHSIESGIVRPVREGEPLDDDALFLRRRGNRNEFEVERIFGEEAGSKGPARVNNAAYRKNWNNIFGAKKRPGLA